VNTGGGTRWVDVLAGLRGCVASIGPFQIQNPIAGHANINYTTAQWPFMPTSPARLGWFWAVSWVGIGLVWCSLFGTGTGILWAPRPCYETMQEIIFYEPLAGLLCLRTPYVRDGNLTGKGQVVRGYMDRGPGPFHSPRVQLNDFGKALGMRSALTANPIKQ